MSTYRPYILTVQLRTKGPLQGETKAQYIARLEQERAHSANCIEELQKYCAEMEELLGFG